MTSYEKPRFSVWPKLTYDLCVLNDPYEYDASANHERRLRRVTMFTTPPSASVPNPTGTTPR